jgi:hypothetical protein
MADLTVTAGIAGETEVGVEAFNTPDAEIVAAFNSHKNGTDYRHDSSHIDVESLAAVLTADVAASDLETVLRRFSYGFLHAVNPHAANWASALTGLAADENTHDNYVLLRSHAHSDNTNGGKLLQANTHQSVDTDLSTGAIHHTIGTGAFQAAAGNHLHDTRYALLTAINANNGIAGLGATGLISDTQISTNIARVSDVAGLSASTTASLATKSNVAHVHGAGGEVAIGTAGIAANAVTSTQIANDAVTTLKIIDGAVTLNKLATDSVNGSKLQALAVGASHLTDGAVSTVKLADNAVSTVKILDAAVTNAKLANGIVTDAKVSAGGLGTTSHADGSITTVKLADYAVTQNKIADGAIMPTIPASLSVQILPIRKWNNLNKAVEYLGEIKDMSSFVPGAGLRRYVLVQVNSTGAANFKLGDPTGGTPSYPDKDADMTGLGFVYLEYGMPSITAANIYPWRGPSEGGGAGSGGGSPIGHVHGMSNEARILEIGLDPGFARPTASPSFQVLVSGLRYRASSGQSKFWGGGLVGPFSVPATGLTTYAVYLDPATNVPVILAGTNHPTTPISPAFVGDQRSLCYVHMRAGATYIGASDDGVNGWIEDARTFVAGGGGAATVNGVATGGTGVASFSAGLVYSSGGTSPLTTVAAPTGSLVGTTDAQSLTNKNFQQANNGVVAAYFQQTAGTTVDLVSYLGTTGEGSPNFGNVSRYKTFGFGAAESTGLRRVFIGGTLTGVNPSQLIVNGTLNSTGNGQTPIAVGMSPTFGASGFTGINAYGVNVSLLRTGGDTGTFAQTCALQVSAAAFGTTNYAAIISGATQINGTLGVSSVVAFSSSLTVATNSAFGGAPINATIAVNIAGNYMYGVNSVPAFTAGAGGISMGVQAANTMTVPTGVAASALYGLYTAPTLVLQGTGTCTTSYALFSVAATGAGANWAGYFSGNVAIFGTLSKTAGTFRIDHPLDPTNKDLIHGFVEAPFYDLLYSDTVALKNGKASVDVDNYARMQKGTLDALATRFRVFTTNETGWTPVRGSYKSGIITIESQDIASVDTISWLLIGERHDAYVMSGLDPNTDKNGRLQTEWDKPAPDAGETTQQGRKGYYNTPEAYGKPRVKPHRPNIDQTAR